MSGKFVDYDAPTQIAQRRPERQTNVERRILKRKNNLSVNFFSSMIRVMRDNDLQFIAVNCEDKIILIRLAIPAHHFFFVACQHRRKCID